MIRCHPSRRRWRDPLRGWMTQMVLLDEPPLPAPRVDPQTRKPVLQGVVRYSSRPISDTEARLRLASLARILEEMSRRTEADQAAEQDSDERA